MPVVKLEAERSRRIHEPFPDGESYLEVVERVRDFLSDVSREWDGKRILVVGHAATRWALQHLLCGIALDDLVNAPFGWQEGWLFALRSPDERGL
jgi:broad specificity phosphatase PhoE